MEKRKRIAVWVMMIILVYVSGGFAQESPDYKVFSGAVFKIDQEKQELGVQNKYQTLLFEWNRETKFNPATLAANLKEGTRVFVYFTEGPQNNLVASRIEINRTDFGLKRLQFPFDCGLTVC